MRCLERANALSWLRSNEQLDTPVHCGQGGEVEPASGAMQAFEAIHLCRDAKRGASSKSCGVYADVTGAPDCSRCSEAKTSATRQAIVCAGSQPAGSGPSTRVCCDGSLEDLSSGAIYPDALGTNVIPASDGVRLPPELQSGCRSAAVGDRSGASECVASAARGVFRTEIPGRAACDFMCTRRGTPAARVSMRGARAWVGPIRPCPRPTCTRTRTELSCSLALEARRASRPHARTRIRRLHAR